MKWVLIVIAMNGVVSTAEFNTEIACNQAALAIDIHALELEVSKWKESYTRHAAVSCLPKGQEG